MDLILWRHAEAADGADGQDDLDRPLTGRGERHATRIHARDSKIEVLVVPTNEEWMIGHHAVNLLGL